MLTRPAANKVEKSLRGGAASWAKSVLGSGACMGCKVEGFGARGTLKILAFGIFASSLVFGCFSLEDHQRTFGMGN